MKKFKYVLISLFFSSCVKAESYANFLWGLDVLPTPSNIHVAFDDYTDSANGVISAVGGVYGGTVLAASCKNDDNLDYTDIVDGHKTNWVLLPNEYESHGLKFKITNIGSPWVYTTSAPVPPGYSAWTAQIGGFKWNISTCFDVGFKYNGVEVTWANLPFTLNINRGSAVPGRYSVRIPFYYGFEENKAYQGVNSGSVASNAAYLIYSLTKPLHIPVDVDIRSKCAFNTSPINLSHGFMTGTNADGNQTNLHKLQIDCSAGTSVSVNLLGMQAVSGKTSNYTRCGSGGMCELTFENGNYNETMRIDGSKTLSIRSTYRLNDVAKPVAESFEGSAVLRVLVN